MGAAFAPAMHSCTRIGTFNLLLPATCLLGCEGRIPVSNCSSPLSAPGSRSVFFQARASPDFPAVTACTRLRSGESVAGLTTTFTAPSDGPEIIYVQSDFHSQLDIG